MWRDLAGPSATGQAQKLPGQSSKFPPLHALRLRCPGRRSASACSVKLVVGQWGFSRHKAPSVTSCMMTSCWGTSFCPRSSLGHQFFFRVVARCSRGRRGNQKKNTITRPRCYADNGLDDGARLHHGSIFFPSVPSVFHTVRRLFPLLLVFILSPSCSVKYLSSSRLDFFASRTFGWDLLSV